MMKWKIYKPFILRKHTIKLEIDEATKALNRIEEKIKLIEGFKEGYEQCIATKYTKS